MCIIISRPKNNSPLCDIFLYKSKKFLSQQINTGTSQQTIPNGTSFIVLSTFFCCAVHNNFSWWHFKNQLNNSLPQYPKELAHSSILLIQNCDEKKNVKAKKISVKIRCHIPHLFLNWLCLNQVFKYLVTE